MIRHSYQHSLLKNQCGTKILCENILPMKFFQSKFRQHYFVFLSFIKSFISIGAMILLQPKNKWFLESIFYYIMYNPISSTKPLMGEYIWIHPSANIIQKALFLPRLLKSVIANYYLKHVVAWYNRK